MGTDKAYERLVQAKLAKPVAGRRGTVARKHTELTPVQIVAMSVMNTHMNIIGPSAATITRATALKIIEEAVAVHITKMSRRK